MCKIKQLIEVEISTAQIIEALMSGEMTNERREDIAVALMESMPEDSKATVVERVFTGDSDKQLCMMLLEDEYEKLLEVAREVVRRMPGNADEAVAKFIRSFIDPRGIHSKQEVCYDLQQLIAYNL